MSGVGEIDSYASAPELPAMGEGDDAGWVSARNALDLVSPSYEKRSEAQSAIIHRAALGRLESRCALRRFESRHQSPQITDDTPGWAIDQEFWKEFEDFSNRAKTDWVAGDFSSRQLIKSGEAKGYPRSVTSLSGVEFRESQVLDIVGATSAVATMKPTPTKSVSASELTKWARSYLSSREGLVHDQIAEAARAQFAGRTVTRRPLREAVKAANYPVSRGKPSRKDRKPAN